jgi:hypothetical protein
MTGSTTLPVDLLIFPRPPQQLPAGTEIFFRAACRAPSGAPARLRRETDDLLADEVDVGGQYFTTSS